MSEFVVVLLGLLLGHPLNRLIDRQSPPEGRGLPPVLSKLTGGCSPLSLLVLALSAGMALALYTHYGLGPRFVLFYAASLVLIDTGAVDWRVRLIDTLVLVIATLLLLLLSSLGVGWQRALLGAIAAGTVFLLLFLLARVLFPSHSAPFGLGDVYLGIFIGALVGIFHLGPALFYGIALAGLVSLCIIIARAAGRQTPVYISYGTFLCLGTLLYLTLERI